MCLEREEAANVGMSCSLLTELHLILNLIYTPICSRWLAQSRGTARLIPPHPRPSSSQALL